MGFGYLHELNQRVIFSGNMDYMGRHINTTSRGSEFKFNSSQFYKSGQSQQLIQPPINYELMLMQGNRKNNQLRSIEV